MTAKLSADGDLLSTRVAVDWLMFDTNLPDFQWYRTTCSHATSSYLDWNSNGCSIPETIKGTFEEFDMTRACDRHDFGYRNFPRLNAMTDAVRERVDGQLLVDMTYLCSSQYGSAVRCYAQGAEFYAAVRVCGDQVYGASTKEACLDDLVPAPVEKAHESLLDTLTCGFIQMAGRRC